MAPKTSTFFDVKTCLGKSYRHNMASQHFIEFIIGVGVFDHCCTVCMVPLHLLLLPPSLQSFRIRIVFIIVIVLQPPCYLLILPPTLFPGVCRLWSLLSMSMAIFCLFDVSFLVSVLLNPFAPPTYQLPIAICHLPIANC